MESLAAGATPEPVLAEVQVFRLGPVWLVTLPGEVFVEIGWRVRDAVTAAAGTDPGLVVVAAYANGNVGYVPTGAAIPEGGYEVTAYRHMGRLAGYAPETEALLAATAAGLRRVARGLSPPSGRRGAGRRGEALERGQGQGQGRLKRRGLARAVQDGGGRAEAGAGAGQAPGEAGARPRSGAAACAGAGSRRRRRGAGRAPAARPPRGSPCPPGPGPLPEGRSCRG